MITLITGIPGSGKTAHVVEMILAELEKGRTIYSLGIPDLVATHQVPDDSCPGGIRTFACEQAGNPRTWQKGTWLGIDTYQLPDASEDEFDDSAIDDASSAWKPNGNGCVDKGALIIIDECQTYFRPRSSSSKVPDFIAAFEVHRHQGLDFWLLTQRPNLIDGNLRGLISRHIHIHTSSMGKKRLEWAEVQDPNSKQARSLANKSAYKPNPKVFDLYRSAQVHTKLKLKLPNGVYMLVAMMFILVCTIGFLYSHFKSRVAPDQVASDQVSSGTLPPVVSVASTPAAPARLAPRASPEPLELGGVQAFDSEKVSDSVELSGCFASHKKCACQLKSGADAGYPVDKCLAYLGLDSLPVRAGTLGDYAVSNWDRWNREREHEFHRLHPHKDYVPIVHGADGFKPATYYARAVIR